MGTNEKQLSLAKLTEMITRLVKHNILSICPGIWYPTIHNNNVISRSAILIDLDFI